MARTTEPRNAIGAIIAILGLAAIIAGIFLPWFAEEEGRAAFAPRNTAIGNIMAPVNASPGLASVGLLIAAGGLVLIIGGLAASRIIALIGALGVLAAAGLWAWNVFDGALPALADMQIGAWLTFGGAVICLLLCPFLRARVRNIDDDGVTPNQLALPYN